MTEEKQPAEHTHHSGYGMIGRNPEQPRRFCRKCLTRELGRDEYFRSLHEYIAQLDAELKVEAHLYEERLAKCKTCEKLAEGMCTICGCYVELRAAMKKNRCPMVHPMWERVKEDADSTAEY